MYILEFIGIKLSSVSTYFLVSVGSVVMFPLSYLTLVIRVFSLFPLVKSNYKFLWIFSKNKF